jgi:hypothetical protein
MGELKMKHTFETVAGDVIEIKPISIMDLQLAQIAAKKEFEEKGYLLTPPKYEVEVLGGGIEYHPHTSETIGEADDDIKTLYEEYLTNTKKLQDEIQKRTALVFLEGIIVELPKDNAWAVRRQALFGEEIPTGEEELKLHYVNNVLLKTLSDKKEIMLKIQVLSMTGFPEEAIQAMENLFRGQVEKRATLN